ncbi:APC family permease [Pengzhenrongella frigida]|uniref:APC family permease n=1 Tax=Pengzhenrongella frigida TaxID=1259133 RepID=A0A4Q5MVU4_9MICO|nr:APC family permease [Cellulomonas sp. HLT2-17]RYV49619.1 APC family permease [Cellulomonas sp. HLT2-17]
MTALQRAIAHPVSVPGMRSTSPVAGLDRRSVGAWDVLGQSVAAAAPAAATTTVPVLVATSAGGATLPAVVAATLLALLVSVAVNVFTRRMAATGSLYTFVSRALGARAGVVAGVAILLGYSFIAMFALTGAASYLGPLAEELGIAGVVLLPVLALPVLVVPLWGARRTARVAVVMEGASLLLIVVLGVALLMRTGPPDWGGMTHTVTAPGMVVGTVLALTGFVGFESASTLGVEARRTFTTVPRAVTWTVVVSGVIYVGAVTLQLTAFQALGRDLGSSTSPVNELSAAFGPPWLAGVLDVAIALSFLACAIASAVAMARILFAMGRELVLPEWFGHVNRVRQVPTVATRVAVALIAGPPVLAAAVGLDLQALMGVFIVLAAAGFLTAYALVCFAAPAFARQIGEPHPWTTVLSWSGAVLISASLVTFLVLQVMTAHAATAWAFVVLLAAGTGLGWLRLARSPVARDRVGMYDEPTSQDILGGDS